MKVTSLAAALFAALSLAQTTQSEDQLTVLHDVLESIEDSYREQQSLTEGELADEDPDYLEWDDSEFAKWYEEQSDDEDGLYDWDDFKESFIDEYSE